MLFSEKLSSVWQAFSESHCYPAAFERRQIRGNVLDYRFRCQNIGNADSWIPRQDKSPSAFVMKKQGHVRFWCPPLRCSWAIAPEELLWYLWHRQDNARFLRTAPLRAELHSRNVIDRQADCELKRRVLVPPIQPVMFKQHQEFQPP